MSYSWTEAVLLALNGTYSAISTQSILNTITEKGYRDSYGATPERSASAACTRLVESGLLKRTGTGYVALTDKGHDASNDLVNKAQASAVNKATKKSAVETSKKKPTVNRDTKNPVSDKVERDTLKKAPQPEPEFQRQAPTPAAKKGTKKPSKVKITPAPAPESNKDEAKYEDEISRLQIKHEAEIARLRAEHSKAVERARSDAARSIETKLNAKFKIYEKRLIQQAKDSETRYRDAQRELEKLDKEARAQREASAAAAKAPTPSKDSDNDHENMDKWREAIMRVIEKTNCPTHIDVLRKRSLLSYPELVGGDDVFARVMAACIRGKVLVKVMDNIYKRGPKFSYVPRIDLSEAVYPAGKTSQIVDTRRASGSSLPRDPSVSTDGIFIGRKWNRDKLRWSSGQVALKGRVDNETSSTNYASNPGVYILYDGDNPIFVGRTLSSTLGHDLKDHVSNVLGPHWDNFTWISSHNAPDSVTYAALAVALDPQANRELGFKTPYTPVRQEH